MLCRLCGGKGRAVELNRELMRKLLFLVAFAIVLFWGMQNMAEVGAILQTVLAMLTPFLLGLAFAFVLNVPLRAIETRLFAPRAGKRAALLRRLARPVSMVLTFLALGAVLWAVLFLVLPEFIGTLESVSAQLPAMLESARLWGVELAQSIPELENQIKSLQIDWPSLGKSLLQFLGTGATSVLGTTFSIANSVFSGVLNFVLGFVFSIYILLQKEKLSVQAKKLLYAWLPVSKADGTLRVVGLCYRAFSSFITGQCVEAVILGAMFFVAMWLLRFPYALMISVLIAFTALIPIFGAFIGCAVGAFMILTVNPTQALWFIILFLVLQQIEGNLIYPRVVGSSVGLPAIWVLLAVTLGGSAVGILGMLIGVPLASVIYTLVREWSAARLKKNSVPAHKYML